MRAGRTLIMHLTFETDALRELCNSRELLAARFGRHSLIVERRLLALWNAPTLRDVTMQPPDRRRIEPTYGPSAMSVCVREAGRIYFHARHRESGARSELDDADAIEIFEIGEEGP
jgi:hypothetical protein